MNKTSITIRLDNTVLQKIDSKCKTDSICRSDFIKKAIDNALDSQPKEIPQARVTAVSYDDGKTWVDLE